MARGIIQRGIMAGKLKGAIPATTPSGWESEASVLVGRWRGGKEEEEK